MKRFWWNDLTACWNRVNHWEIQIFRQKQWTIWPTKFANVFVEERRELEKFRCSDSEKFNTMTTTAGVQFFQFEAEFKLKLAKSSSAF